MLKAGLIGFGYWGPNLLRNLHQSNLFSEPVLCEKLPERICDAKSSYPYLKTCTESDELFADESIDVVLIATPPSTHYELAKAALLSNKHVLVEKPFTIEKKHAIELLEIAKTKNKKVLTDHTYVYNPFVLKIKEIINKSDFGEIKYYHSNRINLGNFQKDTNVIWDLAIHDISIILYLFNTRPQYVSASGFKYEGRGPECLGYCNFFFEDSIAHANVSWLSPVKIRNIFIGGSKRMIAVDELNNIEKIKVFDKGIEIENKTQSVHDLLVSYRTGDVWSPLVDNREALAVELEHFAQVILNNVDPITGPDHILEAISILEALDMSMCQDGKRIQVEYE